MAPRWDFHGCIFKVKFGKETCPRDPITGQLIPQPSDDADEPMLPASSTQPQATFVCMEPGTLGSTTQLAAPSTAHAVDRNDISRCQLTEVMVAFSHINNDSIPYTHLTLPKQTKE